VVGTGEGTLPVGVETAAVTERAVLDRLDVRTLMDVVAHAGPLPSVASR